MLYITMSMELPAQDAIMASYFMRSAFCWTEAFTACGPGYQSSRAAARSPALTGVCTQLVRPLRNPPRAMLPTSIEGAGPATLSGRRSAATSAMPASPAVARSARC